MNNKKYYIKQIDDSKLKKYGFKYSSCDNLYSIIFPLDKYKKYTVLFGRILISNENKNVVIDVFSEDGHYYPPFYKPLNSGCEEYLNKIYKKLNKRLSQYGIKEIKKGRIKYGKFKN